MASSPLFIMQCQHCDCGHFFFLQVPSDSPLVYKVGQPNVISIHGIEAIRVLDPIGSIRRTIQDGG